MNKLKFTHIYQVGATVAIIAMAAGLYVTINKSVTLESSNSALQSKVIELEKSNPKNLNACLEKAAQDYANYIKGNGQNIVNQAGGTSYSMSMEDWKLADSKLAADKAACQAFFKN